MAIKQTIKSNTRMSVDKNKLFGFLLCLSLLSALMFYLERITILSVTCATALNSCYISALFHVAYSYVSTTIVLPKIPLISHGVANTLIGALLVLLLHALSERIAWTFNLLGLTVCALGLFIYIRDKMGHRDEAKIKGFFKSWMFLKRTTKYRIVFSVFGLLCFVIVMYVTPPRLDPTYHTTSRRTSALHNEIPMGILRKNFTNGTIKENLAMRAASSFSRNSFDADGQKRPSDDELQPLMSDFSNDFKKQVKLFLQKRLVNEPTSANFLSKELTHTSEIIREAQRIHFNIVGDFLKNYKYAMLFDFAAHENTDHPWISMGEVYFSRRSNLELIYICGKIKCNLESAKRLAEKYSPDDLVILMSGGDRIIGYRGHEFFRLKVIKTFPEFYKLIFPQSISMPNSKAQILMAKETNDHYCCDPKLTLVFRDLMSYNLARKVFNGTSSLFMAPDMAFQYGAVSRFMSPVFDILWLKSEGLESLHYTVPKIPNYLRVHISDWIKQIKHIEDVNSVENVVYTAASGFAFLQRGRVVITDKLHGHILSTLMNIPHVLIDNNHKHLSSYHNTWTKSVENTVLAKSPSEALNLAIGLLKKYNDTLPSLVPYIGHYG